MPTITATPSTPTSPAARAGRVLAPALRRAWPPAVVIVVLVGVWQLVGTGRSYASLPTPLLVVKSTWEDRSNLWPAAWTTTREAIIGVLVAIVLALVLAVAIDWSRTIRRSVYPLMVGSQTLPIIVLAPLTIIWFGFGPLPKIALVALFTFFAVAVGITQGLASSDPDAMSLLRTMGASRLQLLLRVRLPTAIPQFFTGLKVAITYSYVSAIVAELVGAQQGLGVYMTTAKNALRYDLVFGAVLATALLTLTLFAIVAVVERIATPWRRPAPAASGW